MQHQQNDLAERLISRVCHDLVSPLGAIANGLELLDLAGMADGPELALIRDSVAGANMRLRLFRLAFGAAAPGQTVAAAELADALDGTFRGHSVDIDWHPGGELPREQVKLALLGLMCLDSAMPFGGTVTVDQAGPAWTLSGSDDRLRYDEALWSHIALPAPVVMPDPSAIHFAMLGPALAAQGRTASLDITATTITLAF